MAHVRQWPAVLRARDDLLKRWHLVPGQVLAWTRYSLVTAVTRADGSEAVLKIAGHALEARGEIAALRIWNGQAAFDGLRPVIGTWQTSLPVDLFRRADRLRADLLASTTKPVVRHGDLHHFNILSATRAPWLAIDPKGLLGDRAFDVCQLLLNPIAVPVEVNRRRLTILCAELELDATRVRAWCFVHAVLNALWNLEEERPLEHRVPWIEHVLAL